MQDALRYLAAVLPANGLRVVAYKPPRWTKGFKHLFLATNEEVAQETSRLDAEGITTYIALATYADPTAGRKAANTVELQCLWLDVDYKHYPSPAEAAADVERLAEVVGAPSIKVQSGGGMHAYWVLREALPTVQWKPLADAFQATWQSLGVKADTLSADAARILRLPGSHNRKPEYGAPREVVMESFEDITYDPSALAAKLHAHPAAPAAIQAPAAIPSALFGSGDDLGGGLELRPSFIEPMIRQCRQVQWAYQHQDTQSEPQWFATIQLLRHVEDGRRIAHAFSNKHPGYTKESTDEKLAQLEAKNIGPTTCERFRLVNPAGCQGCEFRITSPIQLGYKETVPVAPVITTTQHVTTEDGEVLTVEREDRPDIKMPQGFVYDGQHILKRVKDEQTQLWREEIIFRGFLCPERLAASERNNFATDIQLYVQSEGEKPRRITIPSKALSSKLDIARELNGKGVIYMAKHAADLLNLVQRMTQDAQAQRRSATVAEQMGWQDDGTFVVGSTAYRRDMTPQYDLPVPPSTKAVLRNYEPRGSLAAWKKTAELYNRRGGEAYQFALCYGAAGVFLPLTKLSGVVLSLYSQESGRGKSTAGLAALSWWGNPDGLKSQSQDTLNSLFHKASRHKNLPILMDEVTDKPSWELEALVYSMNQGREKERLNSDSSPKPVLPGWMLPAITTSNSSVRAKLQSQRGDTQGLFARIIEVSMDLPFPEQVGYLDRIALRTGFVENYGLAGPLIVKFAMENHDVCASIMDKVSVRLDQAVDGDPTYRFWIASCAATIAVAAASRQLGLLQYDTEAMVKWIVQTLRDQRTDSVVRVASSTDILAQFLEQNTNRLLTVSERQINASTVIPIYHPEDGVRGGQLVGRAELPVHSLYISLPAFMRFCNDNGYDVSSFIRNAATDIDAVGTPLLKTNSPVVVSLGRGTRTPSARTKALEFNLLHPALREFTEGVDTKVKELPPIRRVK
ncbi:DUF927 domain-containing protein [Candidimonas nitroreducens]|uniref:DUF927 domain-containing protein n=1 Tax=Candidimonas nitroreducens TaxID=683354 RepID=A0A225LZK8_9BURK|nr:DUF927 domain-containing protein [Candidimonas nitroreducens]OWT53390.1 hypothetical protein CEY11_24870 [Candidimonas nitroreducens]